MISSHKSIILHEISCNYVGCDRRSQQVHHAGQIAAGKKRVRRFPLKNRLMVRSNNRSRKYFSTEYINKIIFGIKTLVSITALADC